MKKVVILLTALLLVFSLAGCGLLDRGQEGGVYCPACGVHNSVEHRYCSACGQELPELTEDPSQTTTLPTLALTQPTLPPNPTTPPATDPAGTEPPKTEPPRTEPPAPKDPEPTTKPIQSGVSADSLWTELHGCWTDGSENYVWFHYGSDGPAFLSGTWNRNNPLGRPAASVTKVDFDGDMYTVTLLYPPVEGEAADSQDLRSQTHTMQILTDDLASTGVLHVMAPNDQWRHYTWIASNYEEAKDEMQGPVYATYQEMVKVWDKLEGYWNSGDNDRFLHFCQEDDSLQMYSGIWYAGGGRGYGTFEKALSSANGNVVTFTLYYPSLGEDHIDGPMPELTRKVSVDLTEHRYMMIQVKFDDGPWEYYYWGAFDAEDAAP